MLRKNDEIYLTVKGCTVQGSGVCDHEGMTVFVRGAVTGDRVLAHIIKVKKTYAVGIIKKLIQRSPMRAKNFCPIAEKCGGCCFAHIKYNAELEIKAQQVADNFKRLGKLDIVPDPIIPSPSAERYRNKAQYPVGSDGKFASIGFYAPMTHRIIDCADCLLQPKEFAEITDIFRDWIREKKIPVYSEADGTGLLRHVYIRKAAATEQIMVCAVANGEKLPEADDLIERLKTVNGVASIILNINRDKTNVVLGKECRTLWGSDFITDELCGLKFNLSALSFYQVNHDGAEVLYGKAKEYASLTGGETLVDLYCGTGTIGLTMAKNVKKLIGVEIVPQAVENAKENAKLNGIDNAEFICSDASQAAQTLFERGEKPDVVILDPPRKGCDEALINTVAKMKPDRVVYVSCDSATLARDCRRFADLGYETLRATPVDMFPRTAHVETVVLLVRKISTKDYV
ncbi:MAG: 23S rRNA (uracil(1939)-C(5))-methyltransferase RlmD, partial [Clostridiaceae bacterium]|nr:23S rRNA (uracil(1939)-C(5))-methyltransferase RlmD [Clostridiaceae bacterium]